MRKLVKIAPRILALILLAISVVLVLLIYIGGNLDPIEVGTEMLQNPQYTDTLLYWTYFLLGLTVCITIVMSLIKFIKNVVDSPKKAIKVLVPFVLFVLIFVVSWNLGSDEKITIIGYEGTENYGFWAQFTDMMIYGIYAMFAAVFLSIIGANIYTRLK